MPLKMNFSSNFTLNNKGNPIPGYLFSLIPNRVIYLPHHSKFPDPRKYMNSTMITSPEEMVQCVTFYENDFVFYQRTKRKDLVLNQKIITDINFLYNGAFLHNIFTLVFAYFFEILYMISEQHQAFRRCNYHCCSSRDCISSNTWIFGTIKIMIFRII